MLSTPREDGRFLEDYLDVGGDAWAFARVNPEPGTWDPDLI